MPEPNAISSEQEPPRLAAFFLVARAIETAWPMTAVGTNLPSIDVRSTTASWGIVLQKYFEHFVAQH
jgi:hypothetical protein